MYQKKKWHHLKPKLYVWKYKNDRFPVWKKYRGRHLKSKISIGESITKPFRVNQGVKQGCILSPLLFNIFLSDLPDALNYGDTRPVKMNNTLTMNSLIWADDLLMLSETENGLNTMLKNLKTYTEKNLMQVNLDKTKCMIFNKTGRVMPRSFHFGEKKLEMVREYRYLGFQFC